MPPVKKTPKSKAKPVPFEDLDAAAVEAIVERIAKLKDVDGDSVYDVLNRAVGDDYDRAPNEGGRPRDARLLIHLLAHDLLPATLMVLEGLSTLGRREPAAAALPGWVKLLGRLPQQLKKYLPKNVKPSPLLPEWDRSMQVLAGYALLHEREALLAAFPDLPGIVKTGVAFLLALSGEEIDADSRRAILAGLLAVEDSGPFDDSPPRVESWAVKSPRIPRAELLAQFGTPEEIQALRAPPQDKSGFAAFLAPYCTPKKLDAMRYGWKPLLQRLAARGDSAEEVFAVARALDSNGDARELRSELLNFALIRMKEVTVEHLQEVQFFQPPSTYEPVFAAVPREVALAYAKAQLDAAQLGGNCVFLAVVFVAHFEAELFHRYLVSTGGGHSSFVPRIGKKALPGLVAFVQQQLAEQPAQAARWHALMADDGLESAAKAIMTIIGESPAPLDAAELQVIAPLGLSLLQFGRLGKSAPSPDGLNMLKNLPAEQRIALLRHALTQLARPVGVFALLAAVKQPDFLLEVTRRMLAKRDTLEPYDDFEHGVRAVGPEILAAAVAREAPLSSSLQSRIERAMGPMAWQRFCAVSQQTAQNWLEKLRAVSQEEQGATTTKVVLLEPEWRAAEAGLSTRAGSLSRVGGPGPVQVHCRSGEPMDHVLTIELAELPELAQAYPGAVALSLFVQNKHAGCYEEMQLVPLTQKPEHWPGSDEQQPLVLIPLEVPSAAFHSRTAAELRRLLRGTSGWVLGEPLGVQREPEGNDFVMQLHDRLDLNCGDSGAVYVFRDSAELQSC